MDLHLADTSATSSTLVGSSTSTTVGSASLSTGGSISTTLAAFFLGRPPLRLADDDVTVVTKVTVDAASATVVVDFGTAVETGIAPPDAVVAAVTAAADDDGGGSTGTGSGTGCGSS